jgi:hypothetical protein
MQNRSPVGDTNTKTSEYTADKGVTHLPSSANLSKNPKESTAASEWSCEANTDAIPLEIARCTKQEDEKLVGYQMIPSALLVPTGVVVNWAVLRNT